MKKKIATELVNFAEKALAEKWGYVWGASGEVYSNDTAQRLYKLHNTEKYNKAYYLTSQMKLWGNRNVCDCSGLLRAFGASGTANSMYQNCKEKGLLKDFSSQEGCLVFCQGSNDTMNHVGVIVKDGYVIHSTNSATGVIKEKLSASKRGWTHWGKANFIEYPAFLPTVPIIKSSAMMNIRWLQAALNRLCNARLVVDGIYGDKTAAAYRAFARSKGWIKPDGWTVGKNGIKALAR